MSTLAKGVHVMSAPTATKDCPVFHPANALFNTSTVVAMDAVKFPLMPSWKACVVLLDGRQALGERNIGLVAQQVVMSSKRRWTLSINGCVIDGVRQFEGIFN